MNRESFEQMKDLVLSFPPTRPTQSESAFPSILLRSSEEVSSYVKDNVDAILFDCDGVIYRGKDLVPNAAQAIKSLLRSKGNRVYFVTNNAATSRSQMKDKLSAMLDCPSLQEHQMIPSSYSCAQYLIKKLGNPQTLDDKPTVFVIGTDGLRDEIQKAGFSVESEGGSDSSDGPFSMSREELAAYDFRQDERKIDAVVVGLDTEFNYRKLCVATVHMQKNPEALFVATNEDAFDLVGADSRRLPGNGSLVRALETSSQRKAANVGKPSKILATLIQDEYKLNPARTMMVGDRLDTDVKFGLDGGMISALVMTGCTTSEKLIDMVKSENMLEDEPLPNVIFPHMGLMG